VASGEEAVSYIETHAVDLLVLDMIMEDGIDGLETYRRIIDRRPDQKAIIVSGYADDQKVKLTQAMGAGAFVKKPYTYEDFGRAVRTELDRA
jgi:CheY-like chemotaxis protein